MFKFDRKKIPDEPGVYIFKNNIGEIIYVGKAKNLKNRVSNYFSQKHENSPKTQFLVKNIYDIDFYIVSSELEALLLENKLIKKHKPKYNINLKDSKTFAYIKISNEKVPKISSSRVVKNDGDYFGPYADGYQRIQLQKICIEIFKLISPKTYSNRSKLYYEIGLSPAEREKDINLEEYMKNVELAKDFLKGKNIRKILNKLKDDMNEYSKNEKYESALEKKKQINAIELLKEKQMVDLMKKFDEDVIVFSEDKIEFKALVMIIHVKRGTITNKEVFKFDYYDSVFLDFLKIYYSKNYVPSQIILSKKIWNYEKEREEIESYLKEFKNSKVKIIIPKIGEKKKLLDLAIKNANNEFKNEELLKEIREKLNLKNIPYIIECFDISNLSNSFIVGAMTRWVNMREDKNNYRRFEIRSFTAKNDDYASIREVVYRRYKRLKNQGSKMPDLIIIDGGKGQLKAANDSLKYLNIKNIDLISIAKGQDRKKNEIFKSNLKEPLIFDDNSKMMLFLRKVRDSVHNFVLSYNKKKREMKIREEIK
jgi:excinuclease ABC subunit C